MFGFVSQKKNLFGSLLFQEPVINCLDQPKPLHLELQLVQKGGRDFLFDITKGLTWPKSVRVKMAWTATATYLRI